MKTKRALFITLLAIVAVAALALFVACEDEKKNPDTYDMSAVTFVDKTVTYDGQEKDITVGGTLPEGVTVTYEYYKETVNENNKISNKPKNAGTYKVVAKFAGDDKHNPIEDKTATLTIEKADLSVTLGSTRRVEGSGWENLEEPVIFGQNQDGSYFREYDGNEYEITPVEANVDVDDVNLSFYGSEDAANEANNDDEAKSTIKNVVKIFVRIELDEQSEEYDNFNTAPIITSLSIIKRVVEISNAAELEKLRTEMDAQSDNIRYNTRYVLTDDIDLNNQVWKTLTPVNQDDNWIGEFDGNGKKITNFRITNESVTDEQVQNAPAGLSFGFWGFLKDAIIHDVTFDNFTVDIDATQIAGYNFSATATNPICFGMIAGRTRTGSEFGTQFENILVSNANIKIKSHGGFQGTFIGEDYAGDGGANDKGELPKPGEKNENVKIIRKNLDVKTVTLQAISDSPATPKAGRISIGGLAGELMFDARTYENCDLEDITLIDFDAELTTPAETMLSYVGGFVGYEFSTFNKGYFKNCTLHNFKLVDYGNNVDRRTGTYVGGTAYGFFHDAAGTGCEYNHCKAYNDNDTDYGHFKKADGGSGLIKDTEWNRVFMSMEPTQWLSAGFDDNDWKSLLVDDQTEKPSDFWNDYTPPTVS